MIDEDFMDARQSNKYDKIAKENMEAIMPVILSAMLGLDITAKEHLPHDVQYTIERRADVLRKVTDINNNTYLLHIEFQAHNDSRMLYRMTEYAALYMCKYALPIKQFVIYMGEENVTMKTKIEHDNFNFSYRIISLKDFDYKIFLQSDKPECKVFAVLGNFGNDSMEKALKKILKGIKSSTRSGLEMKKCFNQFRILLQLRDKSITLKLKDMISTRTFFKVKNDILFIEGKEEGIVQGRAEGEIIGEEKSQKKFAAKLKECGYGTAAIAELISMPVEEIERM
jgi:predicted transposase YdaD